MTRVSMCSSPRCTRPATLIITGRQPGRTLYSALSCDTCAPRHRAKAEQAGPVTEQAHGRQEQPALF